MKFEGRFYSRDWQGLEEDPVEEAVYKDRSKQISRVRSISIKVVLVLRD